MQSSGKIAASRLPSPKPILCRPMREPRHTQARIFYGWWVVLACLTSMTIAGGVGNFAFTVFIKPLAEEFGWTRAQVSGGISAFFLAIALTAPLTGRLIGIYGARRVMLPAASLLGLCILLLSQVTSLVQLYALRFGAGLAFTAMAHIPVNVTISRWFVQKRGQASGFALIGAALGGLIFTPLTAWLVETLGWQLSFAILGTIVWVVLLPVLFLVMRDDPRELGLFPDGAQQEDATGASPPSPAETGLTASQALQSGRFWALVGLYLLVYVSVFSLQAHQFPYFTDLGYAANKAALLVSTALAFSVMGGICFGWASDRADMLLLAAGCYTVGALAVATLIPAAAPWKPVFYVIFFGFTFGGTTPLTALVISRSFGTKAFGIIYGFFQTVVCLSGFIGPVTMGYIYDSSHSYQPGFVLICIGLLLAAGGMLWLRRSSALARVTPTRKSVSPLDEPVETVSP